MTLPKEIRVEGRLYRKAYDELPIANPEAYPDSEYLFLYAFGAYGDTYVLVWAESERGVADSAFREAIDWLKQNHPDEFWDEQEFWTEARIWYEDEHGEAPESDDALGNWIYDSEHAGLMSDEGWLREEWQVSSFHPGDQEYEKAADQSSAADED